MIKLPPQNGLGGGGHLFLWKHCFIWIGNPNRPELLKIYFIENDMESALFDDWDLFF